MPGTDAEIMEKLKAPFSPSDIEWRIQSARLRNGNPEARVLAYVTNRAIQARLDQAVGVFGWRNEFKAGPGGGILCGISISVGENAAGEIRWITKWDGAENTNIEAVKGGLSSAMKRAASQWGIGRYLYALPEGKAVFTRDGEHFTKIDQNWYNWNPPAMPSEFVPPEALPIPIY